MSAPNVACELMTGWWGVGFGGGVRRSVMRVMQSYLSSRLWLKKAVRWQFVV